MSTVTQSDSVGKSATEFGFLWCEALNIVEVWEYAPGGIIRQRAARILGSLKDPAAVEALIEALEDRDREVRSAAAGALREITGQDLGSDPAAWRRWQRTNSPPADGQ